MKINVFSGQTFGMMPQGSKIQSIISVAGHQVIRNLNEPSEFFLMHLDTHADYPRQLEPRTESRAVRLLLTTVGPRIRKLHGRYVEVYGPYQVMLNVDRISIYTRTYVTTDSDQIGQIYLGEEELKVRRIGHDAMMEQDAVHIGYCTLDDCTSARHQREENRSHRASGVRSGSERDADKNLGRPNSDESPTGYRQSRSNLRSRKNTNNGPPHGRTGFLDELPGGREFEQLRPIHLGQIFCQDIRRDD